MNPEAIYGQNARHCSCHEAKERRHMDNKTKAPYGKKKPYSCVILYNASGS